jgi:hypothetical protein
MEGRLINEYGWWVRVVSDIGVDMYRLDMTNVDAKELDPGARVEFWVDEKGKARLINTTG